MSTTDALGAPGSKDADTPAASSLPAAPAASTPAAIREDQIANAVAFLTHPKVRESPQATKRSFLERKGLTNAEIEEAFKRVPEPTTSSAPAASSAPGTPAGLITYQGQQQGQHSTAVQPATYPPQQAGAYQQALVPAQPPAPEPIRWTQVLLGVGVVAASVYALKALLWPYAQDLYTAWNERGKALKEAQERQTEILQEAAEALKAVQKELKDNNEAMASVLASVKEQQRQLLDAGRQSEVTATRQGDMLLRELSDIRLALSQHRATAGASASQGGPSLSHTLGSVFGEDRGAYKPTSVNQYPPTSGNGYTRGGPPSSARGQGGYQDMWRNGEDEGQVYPGGSSSIAPPPGGYLGGSNRQSQSDKLGWPPMHYGGSSSAQPWTPTNQANDTQRSSSHPWTSEPAGDSGVKGTGAGSNTPPSGGGGVAGKYPPSFQEVMEMVSKGITPPNVRTDINDSPPDPTRPLPQATYAPQPKPWEQQSWQRPTTPGRQPAMTGPAGGSSSGYVPRVGSSASLPPPAVDSPRGSAVGAPTYARPNTANASSGHPPLSVLQPSTAPWKPPPPPPTSLKQSWSTASAPAAGPVQPAAATAVGPAASERADAPAGESGDRQQSAPDALPLAEDRAHFTAHTDAAVRSAETDPVLAPTEIEAA